MLFFCCYEITVFLFVNICFVICEVFFRKRVVIRSKNLILLMLVFSKAGQNCLIKKSFSSLQRTFIYSVQASSLMLNAWNWYLIGQRSEADLQSFLMFLKSSTFGGKPMELYIVRLFLHRSNLGGVPNK